MGTATFTPNTQSADYAFGNRRIMMGTITMSSSYATKGDTILVSAFGMEFIDYMSIEAATVATTGAHSVILVPSKYTLLPFGPATATLQIQAYWTASAGSAVFDEVSNTTDLSTYSAFCIVYGV